MSAGSLEVDVSSATSELLLDVGSCLLLPLTLVVHHLPLHVSLLQRRPPLLHHPPPPLLLVEQTEVIGQISCD